MAKTPSTPEDAKLEDEIPSVTQIFDANDDENFFNQVAAIYQLWWRWANFELEIINPSFVAFAAPKIIPPEPIENTKMTEFVYPIHDFGNRFTTSKGEELLLAGMSMCKLYLTIEKIIYLLIERLKASGVTTETEVQIAFAGHELAQRKAFESVINLSYNVVVTNFDPGVWGERYLQTVKRLADKGYGYPPEAPRHNFRNPPNAPPSASR